MRLAVSPVRKAQITFVALSCVVSAFTQPGSPATPPDTSGAEILWLPAGARVQRDLALPVLVSNGRSIYVDGSGAVAFSITAACDAIATIVTEHFEHTQWQPRPTQLLNPGIATSFGHGCRPSGGGVLTLDSRGLPIRRGLYVGWHGEWENDRGDMVMYVVGGTDQQLLGYASYDPQQLVPRIRTRRGE